MRQRRQGNIPLGRIDLERDMQDSDRQLANMGRANKCYECGNYFYGKPFQFSCGCNGGIISNTGRNQNDTDSTDNR